MTLDLIVTFTSFLGILMLPPSLSMSWFKLVCSVLLLVCAHARAQVDGERVVTWLNFVENVTGIICRTLHASVYSIFLPKHETHAHTMHTLARSLALSLSHTHTLSLSLTHTNANEHTHTHAHTHTNTQTHTEVADQRRVYSAVVSSTCLLFVFRLIKDLDFQPKMSMVSRTLTLSGYDQLHFLVPFCSF